MGCCQATSTLDESNPNQVVGEEKLVASLLPDNSSSHELSLTLSLATPKENYRADGEAFEIQSMEESSFHIAGRSSESKLSNLCFNHLKDTPSGDSIDSSASSTSPSPTLPIRWYVDVEKWDMGEEEYTFLLSLITDEEEKQGIKRYLKMGDRKRALASRLLARRACSHSCRIPYEDVCIKRTEVNKPYLAGRTGLGSSRTLSEDRLNVDQPNFNFNISHDGDLVVLVSDAVCLVGVDIVAPAFLTPRRGGVNELSSAFTPQELSFIKGQETAMLQQDMFSLLWSCKEAYAKARGDGLKFKLSRSDFYIVSEKEMDGVGRRVKVTVLKARVDGVELNRWVFHSCELPGGYRVTIAKGPGCDAVDPAGGFLSTMKVGMDAFTPEEWNDLLDQVQADYVEVPVGFLVPTELHEAYTSVSGHTVSTTFFPCSPVTRWSEGSPSRSTVLAEPQTSAMLGTAGRCFPRSSRLPTDEENEYQQESETGYTFP